MTPERAAYHRLMLLTGLQEEFEQELDLALENEDPISSLTLDLAFCMSDLNQAISVLYNYIQDHSIDEQQVHDMVIAKLRRQYTSQQLSAAQVCDVLSKIQRICDFDDPWIDLHTYLYDYELLNEGMISHEVFEAGFESVFLHGKLLDVWALQKGHDQRKNQKTKMKGEIP